MNKPRIAIPAPTSANEEYNQRCWKDYAAAIEASGGIAVAISLTLAPDKVAELINTCQGICLPGSPADVNPQKYGQEALEGTAPTDYARENVDELLIQDAHNLYKPILAICFGLQFLNVWRGGTLIQDLTVLPVNHAAKAAVGVAHTVAIAEGSRLDTILGSMDDKITDPCDVNARLAERPGVNSSHHQAIGIPGDGLRVVARCPQDGVVEAVEGGQSADGAAAHFVLGLQWHPERTFASSEASRAIFAAFVQRAACWTPRVIRASVG